MKQFSYAILMILFFLSMLCFPHETFEGASVGLLLWFQTVLPTLLPFIILSNLLIQTNFVYYITRFLKPFFQKLFGISEHACYAVLVGFLCGYPMGAKVIADLVCTNRISKTEGQYLLSFCNNTSLMFIISYIVMQNFSDDSLLFGTLCILLSAPIVCSFLFRKVYKSKVLKKAKENDSKNILFDFHIVDVSIMNGFETITKIGGYIILFSVLFKLCSALPLDWLLPTLEITNGIPWIINCSFSFTLTYVFVLTLTAFGGFCAIAQTYSMIQSTGLSIVSYIIQKLITALVTSFLALIYIMFIHR